MWPQHSGRRLQVQQLLSETIRTLCKDTLAISGDVTVEGLLGITVNNSEVILVNINELVQCKNQVPHSSAEGPHCSDTLHNDHVITGNSFVKSSKGKWSHDQLFQSHDISSISSSSGINPEQKQPCSPESKRRRQSDSNEAAPSVVYQENYPPGGYVENEKEVLVVSPIEEGSPIEEEGSPQMKSQEFSSIAVVHYRAFQENKRVQPAGDREDKKGGNVHENQEQNDYDDGGDDGEDQEYDDDDDVDDYAYDDFNTETQSVASDSSLTSDPSRVADPAGPSKTDSATYVCSFCSKNFKYKSNLKKHCFEKHNIQHLYKCPYCEQFVVNRRLFKEHVLTHEENRPFKCGICRRMFRTQSDLKRHLVTPDVHRNSLPRLMQQ